MLTAVKRIVLAGSVVALAGLTGCPQKPAASPPQTATAPTMTQAASQATPAKSGAEPSAGTAAKGGAAAGVQTPVEGPHASAPQEETEQDRQLIDSVEKAYHTGLSDYQQGHLQSARANFDYAVDLLLKCHCDLKNDAALSEEFDHIVDAVNTLEMDALEQGTGFGAQQEQAPADVAGNITTPANPTVAAKAEAELKTTQSDLPLVLNQYVESYIDFFENNPRGRGTIVASLERMGRYKAMIEGVLKKAGLPQDLIYQAFAESGFRPQAMNPRSGAGGMWQFMPYDTYGLEHNAWYDERFDPVKATEAYAREIKKDYDQLGDWYLAMAAYDWGAGNVQKAVERTGYADFWELYKRNNLPQETKNYVPVFLAVTLMAKNPQQYGLTDITPDPPLVTDTVTTDYAVDLRLVADIVGAPVQEIAGLNPSLLRMSTPPEEPFALHLPAGTAPVYEKDIAAIPVDKRRYWRFETVKGGETLASVAHDWHVRKSELAFVNQLPEDAELSPGDSLVIPLAPSGRNTLRSTLYRPKRGDTLVTIADRFDVTVQELRRWNHLRSSVIVPGHALYVAEPSHVAYRHRRYRRRSSSRSGSHKTGAHATKKAPSAKKKKH